MHVNSVYKKPGAVKVRNKDVLLVGKKIFLGIEEYVEHLDKYKYTAKVVSDRVKLMRIRVEVGLKAYGRIYLRFSRKDTY